MPCSYCNYKRQNCAPDCIFSDYFPPEESQKLQKILRFFTSSFLRDKLLDVGPSQRGACVSSLEYQANMMLENPVRGCVAVVDDQNNQIIGLQAEVTNLKQQVLSLKDYIKALEHQLDPVDQFPPQQLQRSGSNTAEYNEQNGTPSAAANADLAQPAEPEFETPQQLQRSGSNSNEYNEQIGTPSAANADLAQPAEPEFGTQLQRSGSNTDQYNEQNGTPSAAANADANADLAQPAEPDLHPANDEDLPSSFELLPDDILESLLHQYVAAELEQEQPHIPNLDVDNDLQNYLHGK